MKIEKIFIAGAGLMGSGIAQVCAQAGYSVIMQDLIDEALTKGLAAVKWSVGKFVEKGKVEGRCKKCGSGYYYTNKDGTRVCRKCGHRQKVKV